MPKDDKKVASVKVAEAPQGFNLNVGRERGDGWILKEKGQIVQGRLLGRYLMKATSSDGSARAYYQLKLAVPVKAIYTPGEDDDDYEEDEDGKAKRHEVTLKPGQVVNIDEITALKDLSSYTRDGGVYNIWFQYIKQDPKRRNFWVIKGPALETVRPAKHAPTPVPATLKNGASSDLEEAPY
jgi:hypothetical protein